MNNYHELVRTILIHIKEKSKILSLKNKKLFYFIKVIYKLSGEVNTMIFCDEMDYSAFGGAIPATGGAIPATLMSRSKRISS